MPKKNISKVSKKRILPYSMIAYAANFLWWGFIIFNIPYYFKIVGIWRTVFNAFGAFVIIFSIGGAVMDLSNLMKNEGWDYIGSGLILLSPAIILHWLVISYYIIFPIDIILKIFAIISASIGGAVFITGLFYIFGKPTEQQKVAKKRGDIKTMLPFTTFLLDIVKWVVDLIFKFRK